MTLKEMYGVYVYAPLLFRVTDAVIDRVVERQSRALYVIYPVVYLDCIMLDRKAAYKTSVVASFNSVIRKSIQKLDHTNKKLEISREPFYDRMRRNRMRRKNAQWIIFNTDSHTVCFTVRFNGMFVNLFWFE